MNVLWKMSQAILVTLIVGILSASAQSRPPSDIIAKIVNQLPRTSPSHFRFDDAHEGIDPLCRMQSFNVTLWRDTGERHTFSMMSDPERDTPAHTNLLFVTSKLEVDADGSPRAYSPYDPSGQAICSLVEDAKGNYVPFGSGRCALDSFSDGGIYVFKGSIRLKDSELGVDWKTLWSLILEHKLSPIDLSSLWTQTNVDQYYLFYWPDRNMTVIFSDGNVQQTSLGYPCIHGTNSPYAGYFVSATALQNDRDLPETDGPKENAPSECAALRNINSEAVPYFVMPRGSIGGVAIGDLVVAQIKGQAGTSLVYGISADAGPIAKIGEGSIALSELLQRKEGPVANNNDLNRLSIDDDRRIGVLILGGTKSLLNGDYSRKNIERVGRAQLMQWGDASPTARLNACFHNAKVN